MNDYRSIELQIHHAHLERSALIGKLIGTGVFKVWSVASRLPHNVSAMCKALIERPSQPTTLPPEYY